MSAASTHSRQLYRQLVRNCLHNSQSFPGHQGQTLVTLVTRNPAVASWLWFHKALLPPQADATCMLTQVLCKIQPAPAATATRRAPAALLLPQCVWSCWRLELVLLLLVVVRAVVAACIRTRVLMGCARTHRAARKGCWMKNWSVSAPVVSTSLGSCEGAASYCNAGHGHTVGLSTISVNISWAHVVPS
jgi:hypothetical protein